MVRKTIPNFDLSQIWQSGQCFRMRQVEDGQPGAGPEAAESGSVAPTHFEVIARARYLKLEQTGDTCAFFCSEEEFETFWKQYFDLDNDYSLYIETINPRDTYLNGAAAYGSGIRILRQDLWEMIVSFLISQQNNIVRIRRCIQNICEKYGEKMTTPDGHTYFAFPTPEALAGLEDDDLKPCKLGYRSKYVVRAAKSVVSGEIDLEAIYEMNYKKAREELLRFFGIGEKVADCICLFALHHLQAFPVDTHISQAMTAHYKRGFPNRRYRGFQGVMQQYIFYYELMKPWE